MPQVSRILNEDWVQELNEREDLELVYGEYRFGEDVTDAQKGLLGETSKG